MLYKYDVVLERGDIGMLIDLLVKNKPLWIKEFIPMGKYKGETIGSKCESAIANGGSFCVEVYTNLYDDKELCDYIRSTVNDWSGRPDLCRDIDDEENLIIHNTNLETVKFELKEKDILRAVNKMYTPCFVNHYNDETHQWTVAEVDVVFQLACFNEIRYTTGIIAFSDDHRPKELVYGEYDEIRFIDLDEDIDDNYAGILVEHHDVCCRPKEGNIINNIASKLSGK